MAAQIDITGILNRVVGHALGLGLFEAVNTHEPKTSPGYGLTYAVWFQSLRPERRRSGLATTSVVLELHGRVYTNAEQQHPDLIDPNIVAAVDHLMDAYSGDFTLDDTIAEVDLLGAYGQPLRADAGYVRQERKDLRVARIILPLVLNDVWSQTR